MILKTCQTIRHANFVRRETDQVREAKSGRVTLRRWPDASLERRRRFWRRPPRLRAVFNAALRPASNLSPQELGRKGGKKRAESMTPERRAEIAKKAAAKRWHDPVE